MNILSQLYNSVKNWLEKVDPYYTQRIILRKALFIVVWLTAFNWLAKPDVFTAYALPCLLLTGFYENPSFNTYKQKDAALVFAFTVSGIGCVTFYLLYPFKFTLLFFALAHFSCLYFFCDRYYPKLKPLIMQTIIVSAINMTIEPSANLQIAVDMFFCVMLALMVTFTALKLHPNLYPIVWRKAFSYYLASVVEEIGHAINKFDSNTFVNGASHLNVIRAYRRLMPHELLRNITKVTVNIRNIQLAVNHLYLKDKNEQFWYDFQQEIRNYYLAVVNKKEAKIGKINHDEYDFTETYVIESLRKSIDNWNKICNKI